MEIPSRKKRNQLVELAHTYGLPLYVYDQDQIVKQYRQFVHSFDVTSLKVRYAAKALTNIHILKVLKREGAGIDAVSIQEVKIALMAGFSPEEIVFTPSGVSLEEFEEAMKVGVQINIDNLEILEYFGLHFKGIPVGIRINPHIMAGGNSKISVGHIDSKFGISVYQMPLVHRLVESLNIQIDGIHMHTGSDILDIGVFLQAAEILFNVAKEFNHLQYLDFGSGFKLAYRNDDIETDIEELGSALSQRFNAFCQSYGKPLTLILEPGKYLVSGAGYFLTKANWIKQTTSTVFVQLDSGFNHLIRPMFYGAYHQILNLSNIDGKPKVYTLTGYICETDTFAVNRVLPEVRANDILCFLNAGAYGYAMASNYNSRCRPAEVLMDKNDSQLIRRRETLEDLLDGQLNLD